MGWIGRGEGVAAIAVALVDARLDGPPDGGPVAKYASADGSRSSDAGGAWDQARTAGPGHRPPVQPQGAGRGGRRRADAARPSARGRRRPAALGGLTRCGDHLHRDPSPGRRRGDRRARQRHLRRARPALERARPGATAGDGVEAGDAVAVMCRNHRGFVEAIFACAKLGATVLLMNTDFAGPQLAGVVERERPKALIYDSEFSGAARARRLRGWSAPSPGSTTTRASIARRPPS